MNVPQNPALHPPKPIGPCSGTTGRSVRVLLGSGERHVESARVVEEADALMLVGTHARQDDEVLLPALEGVHAGYLHLLEPDNDEGGKKTIVPLLKHKV